MKNSVFSMKLSNWKLYLQFPNIYNLRIIIPKLNLNLKYHGKAHFCHHIGRKVKLSCILDLLYKNEIFSVS